MSHRGGVSALGWDWESLEFRKTIGVWYLFWTLSETGYIRALKVFNSVHFFCDLIEMRRNLYIHQQLPEMYGNINIQGVSKKRYFLGFRLISVLEVGFNIFTCVSESEF